MHSTAALGRCVFAGKLFHRQLSFATLMHQSQPEDAGNQPVLRRSQRLAASMNIPKRFYSADLSEKIKHDQEQRKFYLDVANIGRAYVEYDLVGNHFNLLHTQVPKELEGRGLGKILAKEALEYVRENNLNLSIECDFVLHFVKNYEPKYLKYMQ